MGFITTFIILAVLGEFSHLWYHKYGLKKDHIAWIAWYSMIVVMGFLIFDFLMYIGLFDTTFIPLINQIPWLVDNIENGRDFMWNSFQLIGIDLGIPYDTPGLISIAFIIFFCYLPWYLYWKLLSRQMWGGKGKHEEGLAWFLAPTKKPKEAEIGEKRMV